jgi:cell division protein FtsN
MTKEISTKKGGAMIGSIIVIIIVIIAAILLFKSNAKKQEIPAVPPEGATEGIIDQGQPAVPDTNTIEGTEQDLNTLDTELQGLDTSLE